jgi:hypothetical protein
MRNYQHFFTRFIFIPSFDRTISSLWHFPFSSLATETVGITHYHFSWQGQEEFGLSFPDSVGMIIYKKRQG